MRRAAPWRDERKQQPRSTTISFPRSRTTPARIPYFSRASPHRQADICGPWSMVVTYTQAINTLTTTHSNMCTSRALLLDRAPPRSPLRDGTTPPRLFLLAAFVQEAPPAHKDRCAPTAPRPPPEPARVLAILADNHPLSRASAARAASRTSAASRCLPRPPPPLGAPPPRQTPVQRLAVVCASRRAHSTSERAPPRRSAPSSSACRARSNVASQASARAVHRVACASISRGCRHSRRHRRRAASVQPAHGERRERRAINPITPVLRTSACSSRGALHHYFLHYY